MADLPASNTWDGGMSLLFERFPQLAARLPFRSLGNFPTALDRVDGLVSSRIDLWIKREDQSGTLYGGNKVRKLELLFGAVSDDVLHGDPEKNHDSDARGVGIKPRDCGGAVRTEAGAGGRYGVVSQPLTAETAPYLQKQLLSQLAADATLWPARTFVSVPATFCARICRQRVRLCTFQRVDRRQPVCSVGCPEGWKLPRSSPRRGTSV